MVEQKKEYPIMEKSIISLFRSIASAAKVTLTTV